MRERKARFAQSPFIIRQIVNRHANRSLAVLIQHMPGIFVRSNGDKICHHFARHFNFRPRL